MNIIATITDIGQSREVIPCRLVGEEDQIHHLKVLPGSLKSNLTLTFTGGKSLVISISNEDFDRIYELMPKTMDLMGLL